MEVKGMGKYLKSENAKIKSGRHNAYESLRGNKTKNEKII
jgi:hypothetical protein